MLYANLRALPLFSQGLPGSIKHQVVVAGGVDAAEIKSCYEFLVLSTAGLLAVEYEVNQQGVGPAPAKPVNPAPVGLLTVSLGTMLPSESTSSLSLAPERGFQEFQVAWLPAGSLCRAAFPR